MASNPYPSIVGGVTNGLDARTALNKVGTDSEIGIRTIASISTVGSEIGYYRTNTVVRARDTNLYYKYDGSTWNIDTGYNTVEATLTLADNTTDDVSTSKHGFAPKAPNDATKFLDGTGAWDKVSDADLSLTDVTTNNVSITAHGFAPKAPNDASKYLDGTGAYSVPAGTVTSDATLITTDVTTNNVSSSKHGFAPKTPNDATKFLDGTGAWDAVADADLSLTDVTTNNVSSTAHGFAPKHPNDATKYLDGTGAWDKVSDADLSLTDITTNDVSSSKHGFAPKGDGSTTKFLNANGAYSVPTGSAVVREAIFTYEDVLSVKTGNIRIYNKMGSTFTISQVFLSANTAPVGASIIVDVNLNGTTIFTTQANRPAIVASANTGTSTSIDVTSWTDGSYLQADIDQVGSSTAGSNLTIHVIYS